MGKESKNQTITIIQLITHCVLLSFNEWATIQNNY